MDADARRGTGTGLLLGLLAILPAACTSTRLSTRDVYGQILYLGTDLRCSRVGVGDRERREDAHVYARLRGLHPWLETQLGAGQRQGIADAFDEEVSGLHFSGCPSWEARARARGRLRMLVNELQNRAQRDGFRLGHVEE